MSSILPNMQLNKKLTKMFQKTCWTLVKNQTGLVSHFIHIFCLLPFLIDGDKIVYQLFCIFEWKAYFKKNLKWTKCYYLATYFWILIENIKLVLKVLVAKYCFEIIFDLIVLFQWGGCQNFISSINFAQWRYSKQWSTRELELLLVEN